MKQSLYEIEKLESERNAILFNRYYETETVEDETETVEDETETVENYIVVNDKTNETVQYCESIEQASEIAKTLNKATGTNNYNAYFEIW